MVGAKGASLRRERGISTARERRHRGVRQHSAGVKSSRPLRGVGDASQRRGRGVGGVISGWEGRQHGAGAVSWRPLRGVGGASQRRVRGVGRASGVSSRRGSGVRGASARRGGRHGGVGGASPQCGIRALSLSTLSVLSLSMYVSSFGWWCHCRQSRTTLLDRRPAGSKTKF